MHNADVEDIYTAWKGLSNKQSSVAVVNTLPPRELPFLFQDLPSEFTGGQIWIHVYTKTLCSRPFEPVSASINTEAL